ncbi:MAG: zinc ribbon domain-containing protein [Anaerolineae bacterium]
MARSSKGFWRRSVLWWAPAMLIGCLLLGGMTVAAQAPALTIDQASLRLWPEYDDPGLLVILSGAFTGTTTFPQQVAFPIPANARGIQATYVGDDGGLYNQAWQIVDGKLTYSLPRPQFQIEFYLDRPPANTQRELSYTFEAPYAINTLIVSLQQPARSTGFSALPQPEESFQGSDGFTYYTFARNGLKPGDRLPVTMRYAKNDQGLSVAQAKLDAGAAAAVAPTKAASAGAVPSWLPFLLIGLGAAALIGAGGYWVFRMRPSATVPAKPAPGRGQAPGNVGAGRAVFCTQCGHRFGPEDRFCAQCGAPRKG